MAEDNDRLRLPAELVTGALVAAATLPLARLFSGGGIGGVIVGTVALSGVVAWGLRRARVPAIPAALVSAAAFAWFASALWATNAMWGPFPTAASIESLLRTMADGARAAQVEVAPVFASAGLKAVVAALVWGIAWLADDAVSKLRHPLLAIAFCLPVVVFPGTLLEAGRWWFDAAVFLIASMAVLFTDERIRLSRWGRVAGLGRPGWRPGLAARMGTVVVVAAIAISPLVPTEAQTDVADGVGGSSRGGVGLNPLVSILPRLNATPAVTLFTVTSPVASYWRLTSLDFFDGRLWVSRLRGSTTLVSGRTIPPDVRAPNSRRVVQEYRFRRLGGQGIPAAYDPIRVDDRKGVRLAGTSRALISPSRIVADQTVKVSSLMTTPAAAALDAIAQVSDPGLEPYLRLPSDIPREIVALARRITERERTPFRKAVALQDYFNVFEYDENVAAGHSIRSLSDFLEQKRGYCEQFAGTMAVLARSVGLPARVAIGFAVGEPVAKDTYRVTSRNAHAWVEVFFPGYGWIAFEPTPRPDGGVSTPSYTRPEALAPEGSTGGSGATPTTEPTTGPSLDPRLLQEGDVPNFVEQPQPEQGRSRAPLVAAGAGLLAVVLLPGAATVRRLRRRRGAKDAVARIRVTYLDFLDWCAAVRLPRGAGETPAEHARRLAEISSPAEGPALRLAAIASQAFYAPTPAPDPAEAIRAGSEARHAIAAVLPRSVRILPAVGWGWWRGGA